MATKKHKVTFYSPGTLFSESSSHEIKSWNIVKAIELSKNITERYGAKPYGFVFETMLTAPDIDDGHGGKLKVSPKTIKKSGIHFLGGKLETYDDVVARNDEKENILKDNMRWNDMWIVCINTNSYKSTLPFGEEDCIVNEDGSVIEYGNDPKYIAYRKSKSK